MTFVPVVVVDLLQLSNVPHEYTVYLSQLMLDVGLTEKTTDF